MTLEREHGTPASVILEGMLTAVLATNAGNGARAAEQKLTAEDGAANDFFSGSVAISRDTIVVVSHPRTSAPLSKIRPTSSYEVAGGKCKDAVAKAEEA